MTFPNIIDLVPHAPPMVLLDRVLSFVDEQICCETHIRQDSIFCEDGQVPAYVGIEYMAQTIAVFGGMLASQSGKPVSLGFLLGGPAWTTECEYFEVGELLHVYASCIWDGRELSQFKCSIKNANTEVTLQEAKLSIFKPIALKQYLAKQKT